MNTARPYFITAYADTKKELVLFLKTYRDESHSACASTENICTVKEYYKKTTETHLLYNKEARKSTSFKYLRTSLLIL